MTVLDRDLFCATNTDFEPPINPLFRPTSYHKSRTTSWGVLESSHVADKYGVLRWCYSFIESLSKAACKINPRVIQVNNIFALFPKQFNFPYVLMSPQGRSYSGAIGAASLGSRVQATARWAVKHFKWKKFIFSSQRILNDWNK
jgi:hypothetical protein